MTVCYICGSKQIENYDILNNNDLCSGCKSTIYVDSLGVEIRMTKIAKSYRLYEDSAIIEKILQNVTFTELRKVKYIDQKTHQTNAEFLNEFIKDKIHRDTEWFEL